MAIIPNHLTIGAGNGIIRNRVCRLRVRCWTYLLLFGVLAGGGRRTATSQGVHEQRDTAPGRGRPLQRVDGLFSPTDDHSKDKLDIVFSFSIPEEARKQLEQKVLRGEVVDSKELTTVYSPKPEDVKRLTSWLKDQGMEIYPASEDRKSSEYARGTVAQFTKSLQVEMAGQ